ncbi:hypothetical protein BGX38DRAFT_1144808 [Terfezia claveryi]|nr:hypothetical protein BGX38DRAFT_1144808 [Terfezia claveryi]
MAVAKNYHVSRQDRIAQKATAQGSNPTYILPIHRLISWFSPWPIVREKRGLGNQMRGGDVRGELGWVPSMHIESEEWRWGCLRIYSLRNSVHNLVKVAKECQQQASLSKFARHKFLTTRRIPSSLRRVLGLQGQKVKERKLEGVGDLAQGAAPQASCYWFPLRGLENLLDSLGVTTYEGEIIP